MKQNKYTHLIWDINGTIMDDVKAGIDSVNQMLSERSLPIIPSVEAYRDIFDFPIEEYYRSLGFDFVKEPYEVLAPIWVELYEKNSKSSPLCLGAAETMAAAKERGVRQIVLSACEIGMLRRNLASYGVLDYFDEVIGLDNIHAQNKIALAEFWRENNSTAKALLVGDTDHDFETTSAIKADCVLYSGGHQSEERLLLLGCPVIGELTELEKLIF